VSDPSRQGPCRIVKVRRSWVGTNRVRRSSAIVVLTMLLLGSVAVLQPPQVVGALPTATTVSAATSQFSLRMLYFARATTIVPATTTTTVTQQPAPLSIHVVGNHLVNSQGQTLRLIGVNFPGMDVLTPTGQCTTTFGSPHNVGEIDAMVTWDINAVRIPLNEDCWLGINGVSPTMTAAYRISLQSLVSELNQRGLYAILDLHVSAPGTIRAIALQAMPDADHSPAFWSSVASTFVNDPAVIFDLFNEPHLSNVLPQGANDWACWLSGCSIPAIYSKNPGMQQSTSPFIWQATGMQQLVNAVRSTGATQPIMLSGLNYANDVEGWLTHVPVDKLHQLIASVHVYNSDACNTLTCWDQSYVPLAQQYPVVTAELGEDDCNDGFIDQYMQFADANGISYLGWSWSIETSCSSPGGAALITNWNGSPSPEGVGLQNHLKALAG